MIYDWEFADKIQCTECEKESCWSIVLLCEEIARKVRTSGLLILEEELEEIENSYFYRALEMVMDGVAPETLRNILERKILSINPTGHDLLAFCIMAEGAMAIQRGDHPKDLLMELAAFFGDFGDEKLDERDHEFESTWMEKQLDMVPLSPETALLENIIPALEPQTIDEITEQLDASELTRALYGSGGHVRIAILKSLSASYRRWILEDIEFAIGLSIKEIVSAQKKVLSAVPDNAANPVH